MFKTIKTLPHLRPQGRTIISVRSCFLALLAALSLVACATRPPEGVQPVAGFVLERYVGQWYEIARLDHAFERGMSDVGARYSVEEDGSVTVINRGFDTQRERWREAKGRARFVGDRDTGSLEVSFFGPFYGGYHIIALDREHYRWSLVAGPSRDYLWILARDRALAPEIVTQLTSQAKALGFATERLIWVEHTQPQHP